MGKRRHQVKTGDKAVQKARAKAVAEASQPSSKRGNDDGDDDPTYDEVDRFHNRRQEEEFLKLDAAVGGGDSSDDDDELDNQDAVMDLGVPDSDEDDNEYDSELEDLRRRKAAAESDSSRCKSATKDEDEDEGSSSESSSEEGKEDSDEDDDDDDNVQKLLLKRKLAEIEDKARDWGNKKSAYYAEGDEADLDEDRDAAFDEEEAAKEIQASRLKQMSEEDFVLSDDDEETEKGIGLKKTEASATDGAADEKMTAKRDISKLTKKELTRLLDKQHPELLPLLSYFSPVVEELDQRTNVAAKALLEGEEGTPEAVGATKAGQQYLITKALVQCSTALNLATYLLLKSEYARKQENGDDNITDSATWIQSHPVIARLQKCTEISKNLEESVEKKVGQEQLSKQIENLVKAAALAEAETDRVVTSSDSDQQVSADENDAAEEDSEVPKAHDKTNAVEAPSSSSSSSDNDESDDDDDDEAMKRRIVLDEARFSLRANEITKDVKQRPTKRLQNSDKLSLLSDLGDDTANMATNERKKAGQSLAATLNAIEQRSAAVRKRKAPPNMADNLDEPVDDGEELRQGLKMMEAELGKMSDEDGDADEDGNHDSASNDEELDDDEDDFYTRASKLAKAKKEERKSKYAVAPKYPRLEKEVDGERAIGRVIMKNRGLVAHKNKLNRNPRVKKREQYRKALIRRKGTVREVRTDEGHRYGGEATGIKSRISRSRKLVS